MTEIKRTTTLPQTVITQLDQLSENEPFTFDLSSLGVIAVTGEDRVKFLQGQVTADVAKLTPEYAQLAAFCNPQGRIQSLFYLLSDNQQIWLLLPTDILPQTLTALAKYAVFYQCELVDVSDQFQVLGVFNSNRPNDSLSFTLPFDQQRHYCLVSHQEASKRLANTTTGDSASWEMMDIRAGVARLTTTTVGQFLPHNLGLPELDAVNFNKGCYTGQEVVARMHYKGKLKSHLRLLRAASDEVPAPLTELVDEQDKKIGEVVCSCNIDGHLELLALCKDTIENVRKIRCKSEKASILTLSSFENSNI